MTLALIVAFAVVVLLIALLVVESTRPVGEWPIATVLRVLKWIGFTALCLFALIGLFACLVYAELSGAITW